MSKLIEQLKRHEGFRSKPYKDTEGFTTIGYGFNVDAGISQELAERILEHQALEFERSLCQRSWFVELDFVRQDVLTNMAFNIGINGLMQFKKMIASIEAGNYEQASYEMMDSKWAVQVGMRAIELAEQMRTGEYA